MYADIFYNQQPHLHTRIPIHATDAMYNFTVSQRPAPSMWLASMHAAIDFYNYRESTLSSDNISDAVVLPLFDRVLGRICGDTIWAELSNMPLRSRLT